MLNNIEQLYVNVTLQVSYLERMYNGEKRKVPIIKSNCPHGCWVEPGKKCIHGYGTQLEMLGVSV